MATQKTDPIFDYIAQSAKTNAANQQAQIDTAKILEQQQADEKEAEFQVSAAGTAAAGVISAKNSIAATLDAKKAKIVEAYGTNYDEQGSDSNFWAAEMKGNARKAYEVQDRLLKAQQTDFMTNPIGFINAQFEIPAIASEYNYYASKSNTAQANLQSITQASDSAVMATARSSASTSTELAIAEGQEAAARTAAEVAKMKVNSAGTRIQGIQALNSMSNQQLNIAFQVHSAQNSDKSLKMQEESMAMQREARAQARQDAADRLEAKNAQLDQVKYEMEAYNAGARRTGKMTFSDPKMFLKAYESNKNLPEFTNTLTSGKMLVMNEGVTNGIMVADNAGEAALIYSTGQATTPVGKFLKQAVLEAKTDPTAPKDRQGFVGTITPLIVQSAKKQLGSIDDTSPTTNIYAAPPPSVMLQAKSLDSPFMSSTVKPMLEADGNAKIPDSVMLAKAVEYAKTGKAGFNDAAQSIALYYKHAVMYNNAVNQYVENGLPAQVGYTARINNKLVNLADEVQVKRYLLGQQIGQTGVNPVMGLTSGM